MIKVDGQFITYAACNNGTTALVTKEGELLMFGKDTTHSNHTTGNRTTFTIFQTTIRETCCGLGSVFNLKGEIIIQVALGKAHAVALTNKGQVYTFGINNKYQCGRDFLPTNKEGSQCT